MEPGALMTPKRKRRTRDYFPVKNYFDLCFSVQSGSSKRKYFTGHLQNDCVMVNDKEAMKRLYTTGFFGKGTLSRGGPQICFPKEKEASRPAAERSLSKKTASPDAPEDATEEPESKKAKEDSEVPEASPLSEPLLSDVDEQLPEEELQLTFEEAFFLSYGLGVLVVKSNGRPLDLLQLWWQLCILSPNKRFPYNYAVYHHFRSKNWVVRSGIKYGTDFVLYKDGPLYYHSTYAVVVKPVAQKNPKDILCKNSLPLTWSSLAAKNRVITHASKGLLFVYVVRPDSLPEMKIETPHCISQFKVQEILVKRWDPSAEREGEQVF